MSMYGKSRNQISQHIDENIVAKRTSAQLYPDYGVATLSNNFFVANTGTDPVKVSFFSGLSTLVNGVYTALENWWGSFEGIMNDEILVDVNVRTPYGNKVFPNLPLHTNMMAGVKGANDIKNRLDNGEILYVKLSYDGGRAQEATIIAWKFYNPTAHQIYENQAITGNLNNSSTSFTNPLNQITGTSSTGSQIGTQMGIVSSASQSGLLVSGQHFLNRYLADINAAATAYGVNACLVGAVIINESHGDTKATSYVGAAGLMQLIPSTFASCYQTVSASYPGLINDPYNPKTNIWCGTYYLHTLINQIGTSDAKQVAQAYNAGPGAYARFGGNVPYSETKNYATKVQISFNQLQAITTQLGTDPLDQRPEVMQSEQTNYANNTSQQIAKAAQ